MKGFGQCTALTWTCSEPERQHSVLKCTPFVCLFVCSFLMFQYCFEQELMRMPSSNYWEVVATSRGFQWLQPIKLPMGRYAWWYFNSLNWLERAPPRWPRAFMLVFFRGLGFDPWPEVWAHWKLWEAGACYDDDSRTFRCLWTPRCYQGWKAHALVFAAPFVVVFAAPSFVVLRPKLLCATHHTKFKWRADKWKLWVWLTTNQCLPFLLYNVIVSLILWLTQKLLFPGGWNRWSLSDWDSLFPLQCRDQWNLQNLQSWWVLTF